MPCSQIPRPHFPIPYCEFIKFQIVHTKIVFKLFILKLFVVNHFVHILIYIAKVKVLRALSLHGSKKIQLPA